ncbi:MAG: hypothetical protein ACWA6R_11195, partial [Nitrosomonas sp.]
RCCIPLKLSTNTVWIKSQRAPQKIFIKELVENGNSAKPIKLIDWNDLERSSHVIIGDDIMFLVISIFCEVK